MDNTNVSVMIEIYGGGVVMRTHDRRINVEANLENGEGLADPRASTPQMSSG